MALQADVATLSQGQLLYDIHYVNNDGPLPVDGPNSPLPQLPRFCVEKGQTLEIDIDAIFEMPISPENFFPNAII